MILRPAAGAGGQQSMPALTGARILMVDDDPANLRLMQRLLRDEGYAPLHGITDSRAALDAVARVQPDLVILDLRMPFPDGYVLLEHIANATPAGDWLPVLVLTGEMDIAARKRALALGAQDFLTRPFEALEARYRIRNLLHTRRLHLELEAERERLTEAVNQARAETASVLARAAALPDPAADGHNRRVGALAERIADELGLPDERVALIGQAAPLHDLGKLGLPEAVLRKRGELSAGERDVFRQHTSIGAALLSGGSSGVLALAESIARFHHERWDGGGYPDGLRGEQIPLAARIVAVADVFDRLTHPRSDSAPCPEAEALQIVQRERGTRFDPVVADAFLRVHARGLPEG